MVVVLLLVLLLLIEDAHGASTAAPKIVELGGRRCCPRSLGGCMGASWGLLGASGGLVCLLEASWQALGRLLGGSWRLPRSIMDQRPEEFNFLADFLKK